MSVVSLWKHVPVGSTAERLRTNQPLGAGQLQQLAANGTVAARENSLRTLWEGTGGEVWRSLDVPGDVTTFPWDRDRDGVLVYPAIRLRVRRHGEREAWPVLVAQMRGRAPSGEELGLVVQVQPAPGYPDLLTGVHASDTITATTVTSVEVQVPLVATALGRYAVDVDTPAESGTVDELVAYLGVWCTSNSSGTKALVGNISLYLAQP